MSDHSQQDNGKMQSHSFRMPSFKQISTSPQAFFQWGCFKISATKIYIWDEFCQHCDFYHFLLANELHLSYDNTNKWLWNKSHQSNQLSILFFYL